MSRSTSTTLCAPCLGASLPSTGAHASGTSTRATHVFPRGATLAIVDGVGLRVRVLAGEIWITEERSLVDLVIGAGESCTLTRRGSALVEVRSRARLALEPDVQGATARMVRAKTSRTGPWVLLHRRAGLVARIGTALDRAIAGARRWLVRSVLRPMVHARARRVLQVRY